MTFHVITLFPEAIKAYLRSSILGRAEKRGILKFHLVDLRPFGEGKHKKVDDRPFGGGAGMVMAVGPLVAAAESVEGKVRSKRRVKVVLFSAKGKQFDQRMAYDWAKRYDDLIIITGRYEGIDERVRKVLKADEISIGHYVLTDGDIAAMAIISAVGRLVPGAITLDSLKEESHWNLLLKKEKNASAGEGLEYPHYTRPDAFRHNGKWYRVPSILLSGDHRKIAEWRVRSSR
jgi:tRNA (guanine37-N1)-methyltransferase